MAPTPTPDLGAYEPLFELASGGMGVVLLARHVGPGGFERLVVVKRIHPHLARERELVDMFLDEARLASQIRHPNVVPVDDVVDADGELFLVQPYVESVPLSALLDDALASGERLPRGVVSRILLDALAGLDGAHAARDLRGEPLEIVHRDVSPHNVLVGADGRSRLIDFGIARAARRITVTKTGTLKGKIRYMAPEQLRRRAVDARSDVFAAGAVLYEALAGVTPFEAEDEADALLRVLLGDPEPPSALAEGLDPAVDAVTLKALAVEAAERWASAAEMHDALERALPPAPAREVAAAVERLAGPRLASLRERVRGALDAPPPAAVEGRTSVVDGSATTAIAPPLRSRDPTPATEVPGGSGDRQPKGRGVAFAALGLLLVTGGAGAFMVASRAPGPTSPSSAKAALPAPSAVPAERSEPRPDVVRPAASSSPSAAPAAPPPPIAVSPRPPSAKPARAATPKAPAGDLHDNPYAPR